MRPIVSGASPSLADEKFFGKDDKAPVEISRNFGTIASSFVLRARSLTLTKPHVYDSAADLQSMSNPLNTLFEYRGIGVRVETRPPAAGRDTFEYLIFVFGRLLETRQIRPGRLAVGTGGEQELARIHRTVVAAVRAGRFDRGIEALGRQVFQTAGSGGASQPAPGAEAPATPVPAPAPDSLAVELLGALPGSPGERIELIIRVTGRESGAPISEARVHTQLLAAGGKVRASLSGLSDASGRLGMRVQLPSVGPSSLALRVEHGGETILLRQALCTG